MNELERSLFRGLGLAVLYVLASPVFLVRARLAFHRDLATIERIKGGKYPCTWCRAPISLVGISKCPVCHATTPGSLLRCQCGATFDTLTCPACSCTVKVR